MEFYSNKRPNLVGLKVHKTITKIMQAKSNNVTISDKIYNILKNIYDDYIKERKLLVIIIILIIIFLLYRYFNRTGRKENFTNEEYEIIKNIIEKQTERLKYDQQPTLNPLQSVKEKEEKIYYPPDPLPINIPNKGIVYTRNIYENPKEYPLLNTTIDYDSVYKNQSRSYYTGTYNTYENAHDTDIINPYGFSNNFNTSTGEFIGQMTNLNQQNLVNYQQILDNKTQNLINSQNIDSPYVI